MPCSPSGWRIPAGGGAPSAAGHQQSCPAAPPAARGARALLPGQRVSSRCRPARCNNGLKGVASGCHTSEQGWCSQDTSCSGQTGCWPQSGAAAQQRLQLPLASTCLQDASVCTRTRPNQLRASAATCSAVRPACAVASRSAGPAAVHKRCARPRSSGVQSPFHLLAAMCKHVAPSLPSRLAPASSSASATATRLSCVA